MDNAPGVMNSQELFVSNHDGWLLHLRRVVNPTTFDPSRPPVLIVPGYGMNSFIFGYHPRGTTMMGAFADAGLEVWTVNMRTQGPTKKERMSAAGPSMRAFSDIDLHAAVDAVLDRTRSTRGRVTLIGASLGGSISYSHVALRPGHRIAGIVAIGSPLRWTELHPALALAFSSPSLVGRVPVRGVRRLATFAVPAIAKIPGILTPYMNTAHVDLEALPQLVRTVEDPSPHLNREIAEWMKRQDLVLRGVHVTRSLGRVDIPLLVVVANRDGIVPEGPALSALDAWGGQRTDVLHVGNEQDWYAHADLFVGNNAPADVFEPLNDWLRREDL